MRTKKVFFLLFLHFFILDLFFSPVLSRPTYSVEGSSGLDRGWAYFLREGQKRQFLGLYEEALQNFDRARELAEKRGSQEGYLESVKGQGMTLWNLGRMNEAAECFRQGLALATQLRLSSYRRFFEICSEVHELYQQGKARRESHDYAEAINCFQRAIDLAQEIGSRELELKCLRQASLVYYEQSDLDRFYLMNERGLRLARLLNHKLEEGRCLNNIALYQFYKGDMAKALNNIDNAILIVERLGTKLDLADCFSNLGLIFWRIGYVDRALKYFYKVSEIDLELNNYSDYVMDLNHIALCLKEKGVSSGNTKYIQECIKYLEKALVLVWNTNNLLYKIKTYNNLGYVLNFIGDKKNAIKYLLEGIKFAFKLNNYEMLASVFDSLSEAYWKDNLELSIKYLGIALSYASRINDINKLWVIYYKFGQYYERMNKIELSIENYNKSAEIIEKLRRQIGLDFYQAGFLRNKMDVFDALVRVKKKIYDQSPSEANKGELFLAIERVKARSFLDSLEEAKVDLWQNIPKELKEKEEELKKDLARETWKLAASRFSKGRAPIDEFAYIRKEDSYLALMAGIKKDLKEGMKIQEKIRIDLMKDIQREVLDEKTAIIEFYLGNWGSMQILITKGGFYLFPLPPKKEIENSVLGYIKLVSNPPIKGFRGEQAAERIFRELMARVEELMPPEVDNIIIIPDGYLNYLPFESLIIPSNQNGGKSTYLIEKYNMSYAPSCYSLYALKKRTRENINKKMLLAVGCPEYKAFAANPAQISTTSKETFRDLLFQDGFQLVPLPYTKQEIKKIAGKFPKKSREIYLGNKAREDIVKRLNLKDFRIIHFASHGFVDESFPFRSALILTPDENGIEDGFLQTREISNLRLDADLVVLSACQSARGPVEKGEGILGLTRIFFISGARAVLSSLWKINDRSTADFMDHFYDYLRRGMEITRALRAAKIDMLRSSYDHPFYWAAFILSGDSSCRIFSQSAF